MAQLPQPKRDYEIVAPDEPAEEDEAGPAITPDAADAAAAKRRQQQAMAAEMLARRSRVVQRGLPVPCPSSGFLRTGNLSSAEQEADELVKREMLAMIDFDRGTGDLPDDFSAAELDAAKVMTLSNRQQLVLTLQALLAEEGLLVKQAMDHGDVQESHRAAWEAVEAEIFYVPSKQKYGRLSQFGNKERLESLEQQFATLRTQMAGDSKTAAKMEKKLSVLLTGYAQRALKLRESIVRIHDTLDQTAIETATFEHLRANELKAIPSRVEVPFYASLPLVPTDSLAFPSPSHCIPRLLTVNSDYVKKLSNRRSGRARCRRATSTCACNGRISWPYLLARPSDRRRRYAAVTLSC